MRLFLRVSALLPAFLWFCGPVFAEVEPRPVLSEKRVALVIGNAAYADKLGLPPLRNPVNDARSIAAALRDAGFRNVTQAENLGRHELEAALKTFEEQLVDVDWAVIYFAGYGVDSNGENYALPIDSDARGKESASTLLGEASVSHLAQIVRRARKLGIVFLDACRDRHPFVAGTRGVASRVVENSSARLGLATPVKLAPSTRPRPEGSVLIVYAGQPGEPVLDGVGDNSPFSASVVRGLQEPHLEVLSLLRLLRDDVLKATNGAQKPAFYASVGLEDYYFWP